MGRICLFKVLLKQQRDVSWCVYRNPLRLAKNLSIVFCNLTETFIRSQTCLVLPTQFGYRSVGLFSTVISQWFNWSNFYLKKKNAFVFANFSTHVLKCMQPICVFRQQNSTKSMCNSNIRPLTVPHAYETLLINELKDLCVTHTRNSNYWAASNSHINKNHELWSILPQCFQSILGGTTLSCWASTSY